METFGSSGIRDSRGPAYKKKRVFNVEASNVEFSPSLCIRGGLSITIGFDGGWTSTMDVELEEGVNEMDPHGHHVALNQ
jgi:hypothetical protein